jgi:acyl carrier protein
MSETTDGARLVELIADVLEMDAGELTPDSGPLVVPQWTSRKHIELVVSLEEFYGVSLSTRDIRDMRSVAAVRSVLAGRGATV